MGTTWVIALAVLCVRTTTYSAWAWVPTKKSFLSPVWRWAVDRWQRRLKFNSIGKGHWHCSWLYVDNFTSTCTCTCNCGKLSQGDINARSRKFLTYHTGMMILRTQYSRPGVGQWLAMSPVVKKYIAHWYYDASYSVLRTSRIQVTCNVPGGEKNA